jgi:kinetochore protein Nuf2
MSTIKPSKVMPYLCPLSLSLIIRTASTMFNSRAPQSNQQQDASYPIMTIVQLCECLTALNIPVMQDDLAKPSALAAQHIYAGLVSELMGIPLDMLEGPKQSLMGMMEYKVC